MSIYCGSMMFKYTVPLWSHNTSHEGCSFKPIVGCLVPEAKPGTKRLSKSHISQCEMAGMTSSVQSLWHVSSTLISCAKEISFKRTGGGESASVGCAETAKVSNTSDAESIGDGSECEEAIENSSGMALSIPKVPSQPSQDLMASFDVEQSLHSVVPLFSFGVITDVQYADIPDGHSFLGTPRFYRHALAVLNRAVSNWNHLGRMAFAIHLGDLVDGYSKHESHDAFAKVLAEFNAFKGESVYHIIGNHCLYNLPRAELNRLFNIPPSPDGRSYYDFSPQAGFRFVILDGYDISVLGWPEGHPNAQMATRLLDRVNPNEEKNSPEGLEGDMVRFVKFNGGVGKEQLAWLDDILQKASVSTDKVIICCHLPLHPETVQTLSALCWNYVDILEILQKYSCVVACLSGHAHTGGYAVDAHGIHYVVLEAVLECPPGEDAFGVIDVFPDRLSLIGRGRLASREMYFSRQPSV